MLFFIRKKRAKTQELKKQKDSPVIISKNGVVEVGPNKIAPHNKSQIGMAPNRAKMLGFIMTIQ